MKKNLLVTILTMLLNASIACSWASAAENASEAQMARELEDLKHLRHAMLLGRDTRELGEKGLRTEYTETQFELMKYAVFGSPEQADVKDFAVASKTPRLQRRVDEVAVRIFKSQSAQALLCGFAGRTELARANFGVGSGAAKNIVEICREARRVSGVPEGFYGRVGKPSISIIFVTTRKPAPLESWTSARGHTHLFTVKDLTDDELMLRLIHEYYVRFDRYWGFGGGSFSSYISDPNLISEHALAPALFDKFHYPVLRGSFLLVRAFEFENRVLSEIRGEPAGEHGEIPCWDIAKAVSTFVIPRQQLFAHTTKTRFEDSGEMRTSIELDEAQALERAVGLEDRICRFMSTPATGQESAFFTTGPRPRIGNGTDKTGNPKEKAAILKLEVKWPLSFPKVTDESSLKPIPEKMILPKFEKPFQH